MKKFLKGLRTAALLLVGAIVLLLAVAMLVYPPQYVYRVLVYQQSDAFDWQKFPFHPLKASSTPFRFASDPDPRVKATFEELSGAPEWDAFLAAQHTQAFIVIQDGAVRYEKYFNNTSRDSMVTSFSVAKSWVSALVGVAIQEGYIKSVDEPITDYLPELARRDPCFQQITIRHLLLMASGLDYQEFRPLLLNSDDILTTYYPDQRKITLENTNIIGPPGQYFHYNKYHPQLLGLILERATGMSVTQFLQTRIWDKLGMEFDGSWSTDSTASDFEKMETGVNTRAIDSAKFGALFLDRGNWQGQQVIAADWVDESTSPLLPQHYGDYYEKWFSSLPGRAYYKYMWWGLARPNGDYDFSAEGDKGQYIYVSPGKRLVIVRHGTDYGISTEEWMRLFYDFASRY